MLLRRPLTLGLFTGFVVLAVLGGVTALPTPLSPAASAAGTPLAVRALSTNNRTNPLGIGGETPVFGWQLASGRRATAQQAYEIQVGRAPGTADVWSSGKVRSGRQVDVEYGGPGLKPATRYHWRVRVWDDKGAVSRWSADAYFETGQIGRAHV